jgi:hypothetical protein
MNDENPSKYWTVRDWKWLVGILIGIMILMVASFYNSDKIETNFSIISSAVSIALALVAIFIALKQDSDNQRVNYGVSVLLKEISTGLRSVDEKVNKIDANVLNEAKNEVVETFEQQNEKKETYTADEVNNMLNSFSEELTKNIYQSLNSNENNDMRYNRAVKIMAAINLNKDKTINEIQKILAEEYNINLTLASLRRYMNSAKR